MLKREKANKEKGKREKEKERKLLTSRRGEGTQVLQLLAELKEMGEDGNLCIREKERNGGAQSGQEIRCLWREEISGQRGNKCLRLLLAALPVVTSLSCAGPIPSWIPSA